MTVSSAPALELSNSVILSCVPTTIILDCVYLLALKSSVTELTFLYVTAALVTSSFFRVPIALIILILLNEYNANPIAINLKVPMILQYLTEIYMTYREVV